MTEFRRGPPDDELVVYCFYIISSGLNLTDLTKFFKFYIPFYCANKALSLRLLAFFSPNRNISVYAWYIYGKNIYIMLLLL